MAALFVGIFVEAALIAGFATTPGKWLFGLSVRHAGVLVSA
jgi:hypothetical protein